VYSYLPAYQRIKIIIDVQNFSIATNEMILFLKKNILIKEMFLELLYIIIVEMCALNAIFGSIAYWLVNSIEMPMLPSIRIPKLQ
jgi:hypothetical protein